MRTTRILIGLLLSCLLALDVAAAQSSAQLFEQALRKERTDGDLPAALGLYQQVAKGRNRELAARALIRIGEIYEQSARQEAIKAYQRVVSEFGDQRGPLGIARDRLALLQTQAGSIKSSSGALALRLVLGENFDPSGMPSVDGRYLTFTDWVRGGGDVALHDLTSGTSRLVTQNGDISAGKGYALGSSISRDGKRIAYFWIHSEKLGDYLPQVRLINSDGTGERVLFANTDSTVRNLQVHDFTPDGQAVSVVLFGPQGRVRFGLLTTDGVFQPLRTLTDTGYPLRVAISPDGRYVAFDEVADTVSVARDVVVVSRDGRGRSRIRHPFGNQNPVWSPDGRYLLFSSARTGSFGLWAVRISEGSVQGQPFEIKNDMPWGFTPMGFAGDQFLYYQNTGGGDLFAVDFDQQAGRALGTPVNLLPTYQGMNMKGVYTKDGKKLIFASRRGSVSANSIGRLVVRDVATGSEKEFGRPFIDPVVTRLTPSSDGRYVVAKVKGLGGPADQMLQLLDTQTGAITTLARVGVGNVTGLGNGVWSHDDKAVYYTARERQRSVIVRHELATGSATAIAANNTYAIALAPSGDSMAQALRTGNNIHLQMVPLAGGTPRPIALLSDFNDPGGRLNFSGLAFTPDGKRIAFSRSARNPAGQLTNDTELFTVPVSGGEPQSAGLVLRDLRTISFAPDGRLVFTAEQMFKLEIWSVDNIATRLPR